MNQIVLDCASQKVLLAKLRKEHRVSEKLLAGISRGALQKVVVALSLAWILLTSAVLARMLGSVLPAIVVHVVR